VGTCIYRLYLYFTPVEYKSGYIVTPLLSVSKKTHQTLLYLNGELSRNKLPQRPLPVKDKLALNHRPSQTRALAQELDPVLRVD
jgi:hypothetical protein